MEKTPYSGLEEKLTQLNEETSAFLNELKQLISLTHENKAPAPSLLGYFTHSTHVTDHDSETNFILGDFHILNTSDTPIRQLVICLDLNFSCSYDFSGKYILEDQPPGISMPYLWELIEQEDNKYWFKLTKKDRLESFEKVNFSDFNIKWKPEANFTNVVRGFIYCEEIHEGIAVVNPISLSGHFHEPEVKK